METPERVQILLRRGFDRRMIAAILGIEVADLAQWMGHTEQTPPVGIGGDETLPSASLSTSVGTVATLIHGLDWTPITFDQGATSETDIFDLDANGITVKKGGSYMASFGIAIDNPQRAGLDTRIALQVFVPDPTGGAIAGTVVDAFNGWITYNVPVLLEVADDDPQHVQPCYELLGATADVTDQVWPWLTVTRLGAPVARPADAPLA